MIAFTALAAGTSWPDLVASKIAAERQTPADSAIANITCRLVLFLYFCPSLCPFSATLSLGFAPDIKPSLSL